MEEQGQTLSSTTAINLAFTLVVMVSYFAMFSSMTVPSLTDIFLLTVAGIGYISNGIYGFSNCRKDPTRVRVGAYFFSQLLLGAGIVYLSRGTGLNALVLLPLVGHSVLLLNSNLLYLFNLSLVFLYIALSYLLTGTLANIWSGLPTFFAGQVFIVIFTDMALNEELARKKAERLVKDLESANAQLKDYAEQVQSFAIVEERNRMAREIHDGLGHYLTTVNMQISAALAALGRQDGKPEEFMRAAQKITRDALVDVRKSVSALRLPSKSLEKRIQLLCEQSSLTGIDFNFSMDGTPYRLDDAVELTLYRAAQEGIQNVLKHSQATQASVHLSFSVDGAQIEVQDNGQGVKRDSGNGYGLMGLEERVAAIGGKLTFGPGEKGGFILKIEVGK
jgi:signal transduction histidine kinase